MFAWCKTSLNYYGYFVLISVYIPHIFIYMEYVYITETTYISSQTHIWSFSRPLGFWYFLIIVYIHSEKVCYESINVLLYCSSQGYTSNIILLCFLEELEISKQLKYYLFTHRLSCPCQCGSTCTLSKFK